MYVYAPATKLTVKVMLHHTSTNVKEAIQQFAFDAPITDDRLLTSIVTSLNATIIDELNGTVQLPNFRLIMVFYAICMHEHVLCYMQCQLTLFIHHGITQAKGTREVRPAILIRECDTQLVRYLQDTLHIYQFSSHAQKVSIEALTFLILTSQVTL